MTSSSDRHIWVTTEDREPPDYRKLGRALIDLAAAQAEAAAQAQAEEMTAKPADAPSKGDGS
jgi:hypothetical protein